MEPIEQEADTNNNASKPEQFLTALAMAAIGLLCLIVTITVFSRWLYQSIIPDDVLLVRELMVAVIIFPLAVVTAEKKHIVVTVFTNWMKADSKQKLSAFGHLIGIFFVGFLLWAGTRNLADAIGSGEYYDGDLYIPFWIGYAVYVLGLAAFLIREILELLRDLSGSLSKH